MSKNEKYVKTNVNQVRLAKAKGLLVTPYVWDGSSLKLGDTTYDINDIVGDTLNIEQDDPETEETAHEFSDSPLLTSTVLGKFNISADCIDFQNSIMKSLYGCSVNEFGVTVFPKQYKELYALVHVVFDGSIGQPDIVIPKVKMNSKAAIGTLKTGSATGTISGTAETTQIQVFMGGGGVLATEPMSFDVDGVSTNTPETSLLYLPSGCTFKVKDSEGYKAEQEEETHALTVALSGTGMLFSKDADSTGKTATVTGDGTITVNVVEGGTWCKFTQSAKTITVKVDANDSTSRRYATVSVSNGTETVTFKVIQKGASA